MTDSTWNKNANRLLDEYVRKYYDAYFHFRESYPETDNELAKDIQHWLDIGVPRPWADMPED